MNHRSSFNTLVEALLERGDKERARTALLFNLEKMPDIAVNYDYTSARAVNYLYQVNEDEKAKEIAQLMGDRAIEMLDYLMRSNNGSLGFDVQVNLVILDILLRTLYRNGEDELAKKYEEAYGEAVGGLNLNRRNY